MKKITDPLPTPPRPTLYYGKYRGLVVENADPMQIGRIVASVPDVLGSMQQLGPPLRAHRGNPIRSVPRAASRLPGLDRV
jgi:hypothetical protein